MGGSGRSREQTLPFVGREEKETNGSPSLASILTISSPRKREKIKKYAGASCVLILAPAND
jgi:hypothetical protein